MSTYTAKFDFDEHERVWNVSARLGKHGNAATYGRTFAKAAFYIREAVALVLDVDEDSFELEFEIMSSNKAVTSDDLYELQEAREELEAAAERNREIVNRLAHELVVDLGLSVRDAGAILGLSGARVAQILDGQKPQVA